MFDQGAFEQTFFDRVLSVSVYGTFEIEHDGSVEIYANVMVYVDFEIDHELENIFDALREPIGSFILEHINETMFEWHEDMVGVFEIEGKLEMNFSAGRFHVDVIEFTGEFKPGDKIIIDSEKLKITLNGQNALHLMQGDFFDLNTGENEITYTDDQTGRSVRMRVTFKDKFV